MSKTHLDLGFQASLAVPQALVFPSVTTLTPFHNWFLSLVSTESNLVLCLSIANTQQVSDTQQVLST